MEHDYIVITDDDDALARDNYLEEFKRRLAQSMANPIRKRLDYQGIARKLFIVQQLPDGALPTYDRKVDV